MLMIILNVMIPSTSEGGIGTGSLMFFTKKIDLTSFKSCGKWCMQACSTPFLYTVPDLDLNKFSF